MRPIVGQIALRMAVRGRRASTSLGFNPAAITRTYPISSAAGVSVIA
jgi:hypothetical protein